MMKYFTVSISLLLVLLVSCNKSENTTSDKEEALVENYIWEFGLDYSSTECLEQLEKAKVDAEKDSLTFTVYYGRTPRYNEELKELWSKENIHFDSRLSCTTVERNCYGYYMDSVVKSRFSQGFIDSMEKKADSIYLAAWQTKTYMYWHLDQNPTYKMTYPEYFIKRDLIYPKGWDTIPMHLHQYIEVIVTIDNTGEMLDWSFDSSHILKPINEKHLPVLKKQIGVVLKGMGKWEPGILDGKKVKSEILLNINLDKD
ncbi:hypothetical protein V6R21_03175 [Limibacter armeniacum]|uniref:hypothetical protein n=1 Tax=Limibacter armeniacum TaxID=466084 RepID=UPI002FE5F419